MWRSEPAATGIANRVIFLFDSFAVPIPSVEYDALHRGRNENGGSPATANRVSFCLLFAYDLEITRVLGEEAL